MRPHARPSAYRAILGNRPFVALWLGQAISRFGDALYDLALLWYVLDTTGSAFAAAGITIAAVGGRLVGSLIAGMALDCLPTRRLMLAVEALRCALTAALGGAGSWALAHHWRCTMPSPARSHSAAHSSPRPGWPRYPNSSRARRW